MKIQYTNNILGGDASYTAQELDFMAIVDTKTPKTQRGAWRISQISPTEHS